MPMMAAYGLKLPMTGRAFRSNIRTRFFLPFYRVEGSRARSTGGSGLGLSIVKTVIDAHDGRISLRNMPGKGLEVTISLPRRIIAAN